MRFSFLVRRIFIGEPGPLRRNMRESAIYARIECNPAQSNVMP
jgi:hypothetical protein